ncbi:MAG: cobyrinate a,c-diamide synthase [Tolumonas sp.]|nr:cobyrinate a,c-diamide synthase [Tolumonas sp.]
MLISAPASHSGKTTVTAALARYWTQQGKKVRVFKTGPDFLDPMLLEHASGAPVHQLDLWMMGEANCRRRLAEAAQEADLILIEGVMGLYDGHTSSADIARLFNIPLLLVVDGSAMAQTFGALVYGLANYQPDLTVFGVVANRVNSAGHARYLQQSLPNGIHFCGYMPSNEAITLPERHLGLVQANELSDLEPRLDLAAEQLASHGALHLPPASEFSYPISNKVYGEGLTGVTIAVARDAAFSFIYRDNLQILQQMGAQLRFFSPVTDQVMPEADALYLPGGYPELYLDRLADNQTMLQSIRAHVQADKPTVAECGGMLYLLNGLTNKEGHRRDLLGVLPGEALMEPRLSGLGVLSAAFPFGEVRGHTFHYSSSQIRAESTLEAQHPVHGKPEPVYQQGRLLASYVHWYLGDEPEACLAWFKP